MGVRRGMSGRLWCASVLAALLLCSSAVFATNVAVGGSLIMAVFGGVPAILHGKLSHAVFMTLTSALGTDAAIVGSLACFATAVFGVGFVEMNENLRNSLFALGALLMIFSLGILELDTLFVQGKLLR